MQNVLTEAAGAGARAAMFSTNDTYQTKAQDAADHVLVANKMGISDGATVVASELVVVNGYNAVKVKVTRDFSFIPSGNGGGLYSGPFARDKDRITLGTFTIAGVAIMKAEGNGWGNGGGIN